ncbi:uncharacterized protein [Battus philenor]|uniref:uncharacterized protein n=1 Tax=Battus philenor TaxID=42288 RepID=UPI0035D056C5
MSGYYNVVPWRNSREWHKLYMNIFSSESTNFTKEEALVSLQIWKSRNPFLPSGIESTLTLLEVHVQDIKNDDTVNDQIIRLAYSTALMRFVNHMLDSQTAKGNSLYAAAKNLGVPDWIIDLRHDTAHGNSLPSIELLREATSISLHWLKNNYWDKHKEIVNDYVCRQIDSDENDANKITALMNFCFSLSICAHSKLNIKSLADIPDADMRKAIVNDIQDLFIQPIDLTNLKEVSIQSLINQLNVNSKRLLKSKNTISHVNKALLGNDSLFLSLELLQFLNGGNARNVSSLSKHYIHCFEVLLTFLHKNDLLQSFILELIKISQNSDENTNKRKLAALWVSQILKALKKSSRFVKTINDKQANELEKRKRKDLKLLFYHRFPNEKGRGILLDFFKPVPNDLTDINFVLPIISTYNEYLVYFIKDILNLINPKMPPNMKERIHRLAKLISSPRKPLSQPVTSKVFTIDDVKAATEDTCFIDMEPYDICETLQSNNGTHVNPSPMQQICGKWQLALTEHDWSKCPIGTLPWEQEVSMQETES